MTEEPWIVNDIHNQRVHGALVFKNGNHYTSHRGFETYAECRQWVRRMKDIYGDSLEFPWW